MKQPVLISYCKCDQRALPESVLHVVGFLLHSLQTTRLFFLGYVFCQTHIFLNEGMAANINLKVWT